MAWTDPRTWVTGELVTAALLNIHLRDNLKAIGDPWTAFTPTWTAVTTNPAIGNGTLTGRYMKVGKLVHYRIDLLWGSTTTAGSGVYMWALPVSQRDIGAAGHGAMLDSGTAWFSLIAHSDTVSRVRLQEAASGTNLSSSGPITWAAGDRISIAGTYEAA